jgi:hypothetical protein
MEVQHTDLEDVFLRIMAHTGVEQS